MSYIPVFCPLCSRASLVSEDSERNVLPCSFCEWPAAPLVGAAYSDDDLLAFAEIERAVADAVLDHNEAAILSGRLQQWLDEAMPPLTIIHTLMGQMPALFDARGALFDRPSRAVSILVTTIGGRALTNRQSGAFRNPLLGVPLRKPSER